MIPLTIKHKKEDIPFFLMPKASLLSLLDIEYKKSLDEELKIVDKWIKDKKCLCVNDDIISKRISLDCKHLNKVIEKNKLISDSKSKIERMSSAMHFRTIFGYKLKQLNFKV